MKLFVALALLAVASAAPELRSEPAKEAVKVVSAFNSVHLPDEAAPAEAPAAETVAVQKPELSEPCQKSEETISVKVVELPIDEQGDFVRVQMPDFMLPDISPMMISPEVMRQLANMAAHDTINVGEANPFTYNAEPLENIEAVKVVDSPANEMNAQMEPVIVVQTNDEPSFDVPQQVQAIPIELEEYLKNPRGPLPSVIRPVPSEFLRDPPQASGYPPRREPYMRDQMRPIPREMLRVPMPPQAEGMAIEPVQVRAPYEFQDPYLRY